MKPASPYAVFPTCYSTIVRFRAQRHAVTHSMSWPSDEPSLTLVIARYAIPRMIHITRYYVDSRIVLVRLARFSERLKCSISSDSFSQDRNITHNWSYYTDLRRGDSCARKGLQLNKTKKLWQKPVTINT